MASDFGMSSPTTICSAVMMMKPMAMEMPCMAASGTLSALNSGSNSAETAGSPNQPRASEASVMPSWQADR